MEISKKDERKLIQDIVIHFQNNDSLCLQTICRSYNPNIINGIINRDYSLVIMEKTNENYRTIFYKLVQVCSFIYELYKSRYIIVDWSVKNKNPNDYTTDGFPYFSFKESINDFQLGPFIANFWTIPLIPTSQLIQLANDKFISTEERRYRGQLIASFFATGIALLIGVCSPLLMSKCSNTKINDDQFDVIVKTLNIQKDSSDIQIDNQDDQNNRKIQNEKR